jgi:catechol 2,3-dioxygenase-like lactoylglutathione lyase family enzyme
MEINGIAHVIVTVSNLKRSRAFYSKLLPFLGMQVVMDTPEIY